MGVVLLLAALVSGALTLVFVALGLRRAFTGAGAAGARSVIAPLAFSAITGLLTLLALLDSLRSIGAI